MIFFFSHPTCNTIANTEALLSKYPKIRAFHHHHHYHSSLDNMKSCLDYCSSYSLISLILPLFLRSTLTTAARVSLLKYGLDHVTPLFRSLWWLIHILSHCLEAPACCGPPPIWPIYYPNHNSVIHSILVSLFCCSLNNASMLLLWHLWIC